MRNWLRIFTFTMLLSIAAPMVHAQDSRTGDYYDPLEDFNRVVFEFNNYVDIYVLDPITDGYRFVVPEDGRNVVRNFLRNLREPLNILNNILQGDLVGAYHSTFRMTVNSLSGFGGLLDVAGWEGYKYEREDLGQTLDAWGVPHGPYLVLPFIGPASTRDHVALFAEGYSDPFNRWAINTEQYGYLYARQGGEVLVLKDIFIDLQRDLRQNSADYYAALRNILYQRSRAMARDNDPENVTSPTIPEYDETF